MKLDAHTRVGRLIVIAGPSCSGKSWFVQQLRKGKLRHVQSALGIDQVKDWTFRRILTLGTLDEIYIDKLILHYDITIELGIDGSPHPWWRPEAIALMRSCDALTIVTIWTEPAVISKRYAEERIHRQFRLVDMGQAIASRQLLDLLRIVARDARAGTLLRHLCYAARVLFQRQWRTKLHRIERARQQNQARRSVFCSEQAIRDVYAGWIHFCQSFQTMTHYVWSDGEGKQTLADVSTITPMVSALSEQPHWRVEIGESI